MYTFATSPANVVTDAAGNVVSGWRIDLYDSRVGGTRITDIQSLDGSPLPGYVTTDALGRYEFRREAETIPVLWADDGQSGARWGLVATEASTAAADAVQSAQQAQEDAASAAQDAADAVDAAQQAATSAAKADQAYDDLTAYQQQTPTLEELMFATSLSYDIPHAVLVAPFPLKLGSFWCVWDIQGSSDVAASDTDYYSFHLRRKSYSDGTTLTIATRTTQINGSNAGGGISYLTAWGFSGVDLTQTTFQSGDVLLIDRTITGAPPNLNAYMHVSGNYLPA